MPDFSQYQGVGATSQRVRSALVDSLSEKGLEDNQVKSVMKATPRHFFVDEAMKSHAYHNASLPIGFSQTISQPQVVALMTQAIIKGEHNSVLEIGTGCGYQTAILAQIFDKVWTVERIKGLYDKSKERLMELKFDNIEFYYGDGFQTPYEDGFFDAILLTAAPEHIPKTLFKKLKNGGRLIAPIGNKTQILTEFIVDGDNIIEEKLGEVSFVPLLGGAI
ncbi:Protein-L-isoaspartate O-methyltransferase [hydrothermal vent metagenome]|uniref:protein-L-isoaspartate(D-aspartate) O-methyltransferase n=1 Tax=hydrothermal vent metagenome TaxID=652676 RepID=A0A1W1CM37_9ZZZZ